MSRVRVEWESGASFERFAAALGVSTDHVVAVIPRGGHDEPELWHVFFTTPATPEGDAWDVLLGEPSSWPEEAGLVERSDRRPLVGFFHKLAARMEELGSDL